MFSLTVVLSLDLEKGTFAMIRIRKLTKYYPSNLGNQYIFRDLNFDIPTDKNLAILGKNGAGKSTLFRLLAKSEYPDKGRISTPLSMSWPVALTTGIHPQMTGRENTRFIGRINNVSSLKEYESLVQEFAEIGQRFDLPVRTYSAGMRAKLVFACCVNINFDLYLIDEATSVGDAIFRKKAQQTLKEKSDSAGIIMVSHEMNQLREFCDAAVLINEGKLTYFDNLEEAITYYGKN